MAISTQLKANDSFYSSKYEEIYPPEVGEFVYITDDTYTKKQVLRMEHLILKVLAFELAVPTSNYFLQRYIQLSRSSETCLHLASVMFLFVDKGLKVMSHLWPCTQ